MREGGDRRVKIEWNKKYATIALYAFIVIFCVVFCIFLFLDFNTFGRYVSKILSVFNPVFYGILITYLLSPFVNFYERTVLKGLDRKGLYRLKRTLSVLCTLLVVIVAAVLFVWRVIPQVFRGYADLQNRSGLYFETVKEWLLGLSAGDSVLAGYIDKITEYAVELLDKIYTGLNTIIPDVASVAGTAVGIIKNFFLGVILAVYFLFVKERLIAQIKKAGYALFSKKRYAALAKGANLANKNFGGFIKGQLADALIIGTICFICTSIIGIPYYPIVSVLVGVACIVPVFGILIGTVVGALIILLADPIQVIWFVLFMVILHFVNKRMIRPKIIRSGVEASSVFMFTAIIVMTGLLGFWGLIIGVPVFAILYTVMYSAVDRRLAKKGLATDTYSYYTTDAGRELHMEEEVRKARRKGAKHLGGESDNRPVFTEEVPCITDEDIAAYEKSKSETGTPDTDGSETDAGSEQEPANVGDSAKK